MQERNIINGATATGLMATFWEFYQPLLPFPETPPPSTGNDCLFSMNGKTVFVVHSGSPYMSFFDITVELSKTFETASVNSVEIAKESGAAGDTIKANEISVLI